MFKARDLRKTLVLVSTSGATTGFAGARAWAREEAGGPVDGVIVLGDMAGTRIAQAVGRRLAGVARPDAARRSSARCRPRCGARPAATPAARARSASGSGARCR